MGIVHLALILPFLVGCIDGMANKGNKQRNGGYECSNAVVKRRGWDLYFTCCRNIFADKNHCPIDCPCQHNAKCEPDKRLCICPAGWTGPFCQDECIEGKYGINCSHRCNCGDGARCDRFTGNCICKEADCMDRCPSGFYGADCSKECFCDDAGCDTILGNCICKNGGTIVRMNQSEMCLCSPGWQSGKCDEKCSVGYYGDGCRHKCGACSNNSTCDHVTGHCTCVDKERCDSPCKSGYFGSKCLQQCRCPHSTVCTTTDGDCGCVQGQTCVPEKQNEKDSQTQTSTLLAASLPAAMFVLCAIMALATKIVCTRCRNNRKTNSRDDTYATVNEMEEKCLESNETCVRPTSQCFTNKTYNSVIDILPKGMTVMHLVYDDANNPAVSHTYPRTPKEKHHIAKMCLGDTAGSPASLPTPIDASGEYQEYKQEEAQPEYMGLMKNAVWNFFRQSNETEDIYEEAFDCPGRQIPKISIQNSDSSGVPAGNIHVLQAEMHPTHKSSTNTRDSNSSLNDLSSIYSNIIICPMSINEFEESFKTEISDVTEDSALLNRDMKSSMYSNLKYNLQNTGIKYDVQKGSSENISDEMSDVVNNVLRYNGKTNDDQVHNRPRSVRRQIKSCGSEYIEAINPIYAELQFSQPETSEPDSTMESSSWNNIEQLFADDLYANLELMSDCESFEEGVMYTKVEKGKRNPSPRGSPTISLRTKDRVGVYTTLDRKPKCGKLLGKPPNKWTSDRGKTVDFRISPPSPSMLLKSYDAGKYKTKDCAKPLLSRSHSYGFDDTRGTVPHRVQSNNN
ncbi:uncharacterized protein [Antedon mediterranea]|uniref:uncharacterized protein n=1 Tax=Antedon mediterranea TaxID=105859 RepID=UPI003AF4A662